MKNFKKKPVVLVEPVDKNSIFIPNIPVQPNFSPFLKKPGENVTESSFTESIMSILCINCNEYVQIDLIEAHSNICTHLAEELIKVENSPLLEELIFKVNKLKTCLENILTRHELKPGDKNYILIFVSIIDVATKNPSKTQTLKAKNSLSSVYTSFKGSLTTKIYLDRLHELLKNLNLCFQQEISSHLNRSSNNSERDINFTEEFSQGMDGSQYTFRFSSLGSPNSEKKFPLDGLDFPQKKKMKNQSNGAKIEEIISQIDSGSSCSKTSSVFNKTNYSLINEFNQKYDEDDPESLKKYFYSLCLSLKIKFNKRLKKGVSTEKLYQAALARNISSEDWWNFLNVEFELQSPEFFEDITRKRTPRSKQPQYFEVIVEESF